VCQDQEDIALLHGRGWGEMEGADTILV
jgi:hypothetical protein